MPKSADPGPTAHEVISKFQETVRKYYELSSGSGYAYISGYLGSMMVELLSDLPRSRRERAIAQLVNHIKEFEDKYLIECLSSNDKV